MRMPVGLYNLGLSLVQYSNARRIELIVEHGARSVNVRVPAVPAGSRIRAKMLHRFGFIR
jgi:hypothetical protein